MNVTQEEVANYLEEVQAVVKEGRYQISPRQKNQELFFDYVFHEGDEKEILLSLQADDFSEAVQNDHPQHPEEILYISSKHYNVRRNPYGKPNHLLHRMPYRNQIQNAIRHLHKNHS